MLEQLKANYVASFPEKAEKINQALAQQDVQALGVLVHQIAGSSGSYGFDQLSQQCQALESLLASHPETQEMTDAVHALVNTLKNTRA